MNGKRCAVLAVCAAAAIAFLGIVGCEHATATSPHDLNVIVINPASITISNVVTSVVFTVQGNAHVTNEVDTYTDQTTLYLPLAWSVSDLSLGSIRSTAQFTGIYQSSGAVGVNYITVRDQQGSEGTAVVISQR